MMVFCFFLSISNIHDPILNEVRERLFQKELDNIEEYIEWYNSKRKENAIYLAFEAFNCALMARESWNPVLKLSYVDKARKLYANSVDMEPKNLEIRLLRFTTELQIPPFIRDDRTVEQDYKIILELIDDFPEYSLNKYELKYMAGAIEKFRSVYDELYIFLLSKLQEGREQ